MVRTRFAPSPTGLLHIGSLRTAIYAYALAKCNQGKFVLRIEDTDKKREVKGSKSEIKKTLKIFGLDWDEYYEQSERVASGIYKNAAEKLVPERHAFYCKCKSKNAKAEGYSTALRDPCRDKNLSEGAIKLRVPDGEKVKFVDFVLGRQVQWNTSEVADTTLLKSDGFPTYHLAAVVDDHDMKISHVLRGHDWMPSTPIHLLVYKYLGYSLPQIGHLTDILDAEGGKLSKRKGSTSVAGLIKEGFIPPAIANFVMLLGWAPKDNREIFSLSEFVEAFDIKGLQKSNPIFDRDKLIWFNGEYIRRAKISNLKSQVYDFFGGKYPEDRIGVILPLVQTRIKTLKEFAALAGFFFNQPKLERGQKDGLNKKHLKGALEVLEKIDLWEKEKIDEALLDLIDKRGFKTGDFFMDLRVAICGSRFTPPINDSIILLGKDESILRIRSVLG